MSESIQETETTPINITVPEHFLVPTKENEEVKQKVTTYVFGIESNVPDGGVFWISKKYYQMLTLIKNMVEDLGVDDIEPIPLYNVNKETMGSILYFLEKNINNPRVIEDEKENLEKHFEQVNFNEWENEFFNYYNQNPKTRRDLHKVLLASCFLDYTYLKYLSSASIAYMLDGKTIEAVRSDFDITDPERFTEESIQKRREKLQKDEAKAKAEAEAESHENAVSEVEGDTDGKVEASS